MTNQGQDKSIEKPEKWSFGARLVSKIVVGAISGSKIPN